MILIKAGGSAITDKRMPFSIKDGSLHRLAREISGTEEDLIICHGGGSFGHPLALRYNIIGKIETDEQKQGISKINIAMRRLSNVLAEALEKEGCRPFALQSSAIMTAQKGDITSIDLDLIDDLVGQGFIPIVYGDVVYDSAFSFSIVSGDQIMRRLAHHYPGSRAIFLTDVEGIFTADPKVNSKARLIKEIKFDGIDKINAGTAGDITGGMKGKLKEILQFKGHIEEIIITSLEKEGSLKDALEGGNPGTRISL
jgi:isopentenyl phosphate kinase